MSETGTRKRHNLHGLRIEGLRYTVMSERL